MFPPSPIFFLFVGAIVCLTFNNNIHTQPTTTTILTTTVNKTHTTDDDIKSIIENNNKNITMADDSITTADSGRTIDQHLEVIASPGTARTLRRVRRAHESRSENPPTGSEMWANAEDAITSRHQPQSDYAVERVTRSEMVHQQSQQATLQSILNARRTLRRLSTPGKFYLLYFLSFIYFFIIF